MKKIANLFERDWNGNKSRVLPQLHEGADVAWVLAGEGVPTVKWDGAAVMVRGGELFVRLDCKRGKVPPPGFEQCQDEDPKTGHRPGWIPAAGNPAASWHRDAFINSGGATLADGTYEACGPQLQSNPYRFPRNILIRHGVDHILGQPTPGSDAPAAFALLREFFADFKFQHVEMPDFMPIEGIVWHHPDGRMVKALASDLGVAWKEKNR
jgi:hypothetical protein